MFSNGNFGDRFVRIDPVPEAPKDVLLLTHLAYPLRKGPCVPGGKVDERQTCQPHQQQIKHS